MYKDYGDMYQVDVVMKGYERGVCDMTELDFSDGYDGVVRCVVDGLFGCKFTVNVRELRWGLVTRADLEVVSSEIDEPSCYEGAHIEIPLAFGELLYGLFVENGCYDPEEDEVYDNLYYVGLKVKYMREALLHFRDRLNTWENEFDDQPADKWFNMAYDMYEEMGQLIDVIRALWKEEEHMAEDMYRLFGHYEAVLTYTIESHGSF